jgi:hypothetical protein
MNTTNALALRIGASPTLFAVTSYASASQIYCAMRERSGLGVSKLPRARLYRGGKLVAEVSYNGRVWEGERCVFDPYEGQP